MKDPKRIISREIALKNIYLDQHGALLELGNCGQLWASDEWAAGKFFGNKAKLAEGMLSHTKEPTHRSLVNFSKLEGKEGKEVAKEALRQFKNLLGICGERKMGAAEALAQEWLKAGVEHAGLRAEMFCQVAAPRDHSRTLPPLTPRAHGPSPHPSPRPLS